MIWQVYMILCSDQSLYTGITSDITRRFSQHAAGTGAKYFRGRRPVQLIYLEAAPDRSSAMRREIEIKKLSHDRKWQLARSSSNTLEEQSEVVPALQPG